jgi:hypothetical protein
MPPADDNQFSHFPLAEVPPPPEPTAEDLIIHTLKDIEYVVPMMVSPADMTARHLVQGVWYAHEAIGGNVGLAEWAKNNRTKFYTSLFAKMLPNANSPLLQDQTEIRFRLAVPVKALDITDVEDIQANVELIQEEAQPQELPHA